MPEDPTPTNETPAPEDQLEWTDESGFEELDSVSNDRPTDSISPAEASTIDPANVPANANEADVTDIDWGDDVLPPADEDPEPVTTQDALAWLKPTGQRVLAVWRQLLAGLRNRVPAAAKLPDTVLSVILIGTLGLLLGLLNTVRSPSIAKEPSASEAQPTEIAPPTAPSAPSEGLPAESPVSSDAPIADAVPPESFDLERIATIQNQLTQSSIYNASRVIDSVQADFTRDQLTLVCNQDWYRLSEYDQDLLASQLLDQAGKLAFDDVELRATSGQLIARSPVVGNEMVILLRDQPPTVEAPERPRFRITIDR